MRNLVIRGAALLAVLFPIRLGLGADQFLVHAPAASISKIAARHGFVVVREIRKGDMWLIAVPDGRTTRQVARELSSDQDVSSAERDGRVSVPEVDGGAILDQSTAAILDELKGNEIIPYYGGGVWSAYVKQTASVLTHLADVQKIPATGLGIVAIIDTGIDPTHPVLQGSLVPGYDFVRDIPGTASEWSDLDLDTAATLQQSAPGLADQPAVVRVNQSTAAILDQSTAAILDTGRLPAAFGHGTMVAGIIHLVAPTAQIMPLKAFSGSGAANMSDIVRAIYYATDNGANVINMSFSTTVPSIELVKAVNYALKRGVICVASTGNDGLETLVYPAALHNVVGVASSDMKDGRSAFSNYGPSLAHLSAPGEGIITIYPGGGYAAVSGTSFAAPFVSGGASLLSQVDEIPGHAESLMAFCTDESEKVADMGCGRLDLLQAVKFLMSHEKH